MTVEKSFFSKVKTNLVSFLGRSKTNNDSIIQNVPITRQRQDTFIKPLEENGYLQKCFPNIFPNGELKLDNRSRRIPISTVDMVKHLSKLACLRISRDPILPYVLLDLKNKSQTGQMTSFFMIRNPEESLMAPDQIMNMPINELLSKILPVANKSLGSIAYYKEKRNNVKKMIAQLGMPDLLITLSVADNHWPMISQFYSSVENLDIDNQVSSANEDLFNKNKRNPRDHVLFCRNTLETYITKILPDILPIADYFTTYEFQKRGSLHSHTLLWLDSERVPTVRHTNFQNSEERKLLEEFLNSIITANLPDIPSTDNSNSIHPSSFNVEHVCQLISNQELRNKDLLNLVNSLQLHECFDTYCMRKKMGKYNKEQTECRFGYPKQLNLRAGHFILQKNPGRSGEKSYKFIAQRNNKRVVQYNPLILQSWRANCDLTPVTSTHVLIEYITKYVTKSEQKKLDEVIHTVFEKYQKNKSDQSAANVAATTAPEDDPANNQHINEESCFGIIARIIENNSSNKLVTQQEIFFRLMGLEYFHSSRSFKFISATSNKITPEGNILHTDIQKSYAMRPESMEQLSLFEFSRQYDFSKKQNNQQVSPFRYTKREKAAIVSTPLRIKTKNEVEYEEYITNWLIYYYPQPRVSSAENLTHDNNRSNMGLAEKEALYFQTIQEKYESSDPEENILKKKFENAYIEEDDEPIEVNNHTNSEYNSQDVDILLQRFDTTEERHPATITLAENPPIVEIFEEDFKFVDNTAQIEQDFRKITGKMPNNANNYEEASQPPFDYIANLNESQLAAFEKSVNPNAKKIILVGKPGTVYSGRE